MLCCALSGCFPSPIAVVDENTPPIIDRSAANPDPNKEVPVSQTKTGATPTDSRFFLRISDPDPEPVVVRFFLDAPPYNRLSAFPELVDIVIDPTSTGAPRDRLVLVSGFCDGLTLGFHQFEAYVTDTTFADSGELNRPTADTQTGRIGGRDHVRWVVRCELAPGN